MSPAAASIRVRSRASPLRCALCHDPLAGGRACAGCGTRLHLECWGGACPTLGCRAAAPVAVALPVAESAPVAAVRPRAPVSPWQVWMIRLVLAACAAALFLAGVASWVELILRPNVRDLDTWPVEAAPGEDTLRLLAQLRSLSRETVERIEEGQPEDDCETCDTVREEVERLKRQLQASGYPVVWTGGGYRRLRPGRSF